MPLVHGEKEVLFPTPMGSAGHTGEGPVSDNLVQGGAVSDSVDLPVRSPAVEQDRGVVSTGEGVVDDTPVTVAPKPISGFQTFGG